MGANYKTLTAQTIDDRIREVTESASALFYINLHGPMTGPESSSFTNSALGGE